MRLFDKFQHDPRFIGVMGVLKPAVAGLILAACIILTFRVDWAGMTPHIEIIAENFPDWKSWALFVAAFVSTYFFKANPIVVIIVSGVLGVLLY